MTADQLEVAGTLDVTPAEWSADVIPRWTTLGAWRRFSTKVVQTPACWFWVGAIADDGYGRFHADEGRIVRVSRCVLAACTGPLPHDLVAEHRVCDEPLGTRLSHLRASTQAENLQTARRRDRAGNGHRLGSADKRGMAARSRAIRDALRDPAGPGWVYDEQRLDAAMAAGDPHEHQGRLFDDGPDRVHIAGSATSAPRPTRRDRWQPHVT